MVSLRIKLCLKKVTKSQPLALILTYFQHNFQYLFINRKKNLSHYVSIFSLQIWKVISTNNVLNTTNSYHKSLKKSYWSNLIFLETLNAHGTTKYVLQSTLFGASQPNSLWLFCSGHKVRTSPPFLFRYVRSRFFRAIAPGLSCSRDIGQKIYQSRVLSVCTGVSMTSLAEQSLAQSTECRFFYKIVI